MNRFAEVIATLMEAAKTGDYPETMVDDLNGAYEADMGGADAKVAELSQALEQSNTELAKAKAENYDILKLVPTNEPAGEGEGVEPEPSDDDAPDIDDLFEDEENN